MSGHDWWQAGPYFYWFRDVVNLIPSGEGLVVDVGCGTGHHKLTLESKGYRWLGIDVEDRASAEIPVALIAEGRFPVEDAAADGILCCQVLEHVEDLDQFARECHRILKPGGSIYGSHSWLEPVHDKACYYNLSHQGLEAYLKRHGLELLEVQPGIHAGVLLLYNMLGSRWASRLARLVAFAQRWSDAIQLRQKRPEDAERPWVEVQREKALSLAGHLLWIAEKQ